MTTIPRREFLKRSQQAGVAAAGLTILRNAQSVYAAPANDKVVLALAGLHGRGSALGPDFAKRGDCEFAYLCDVDQSYFPGLAKVVTEKQGGRTPTFLQDFRKALDDK
jgi:hypothetical protein